MLFDRRGEQYWNYWQNRQRITWQDVYKSTQKYTHPPRLLQLENLINRVTELVNYVKKLSEMWDNGSTTSWATGAVVRVMIYTTHTHLLSLSLSISPISLSLSLSILYIYLYGYKTGVMINFIKPPHSPHQWCELEGESCTEILLKVCSGSYRGSLHKGFLPSSESNLSNQHMNCFYLSLMGWAYKRGTAWRGNIEYDMEISNIRAFKRGIVLLVVEISNTVSE